MGISRDPARLPGLAHLHINRSLVLRHAILNPPRTYAGTHQHVTHPRSASFR